MLLLAFTKTKEGDGKCETRRKIIKKGNSERHSSRATLEMKLNCQL